MRFRSEPCNLPVLKTTVRGCRRNRPSRCQDSDQGVWTLSEIGGACDDNGRTNLCCYCALKDANYDVSWLQSASSASLISSRRTEAARNSFKSSSDHESDQSILRSGASEASRSINRDSSPAASGGSLRNAVSKDASCELREASMILALVYGAPNPINSGNAGWQIMRASLQDRGRKLGGF